MYKLTNPVFMITLTSTHVGSGSQIGIVDQPIQREAHTTFPKIEASSLKGCIKDFMEDALKRDTEVSDENEVLRLILGSDPGGSDTDTTASAVAFTDARLLFFPVKSVKGVFAWITCPMVLQRFADEMKIGDIEITESLPTNSSVPTGSELLLGDKKKIMLEEFPIDVSESRELDVLMDKILKLLPENKMVNSFLKGHTAVVSNDDFKDFVNQSTEVITRIRINKETGIVEKGALFNEEYLPSETILYSLMMISPLLTELEKEKLPEELREEDQPIAILNLMKKLPEILQIGGNTTLGKGLMKIKIVGKDLNEISESEAGGIHNAGE